MRSSRRAAPKSAGRGCGRRLTGGERGGGGDALFPCSPAPPMCAGGGLANKALLTVPSCGPSLKMGIRAPPESLCRGQTCCGIEPGHHLSTGHFVWCNAASALAFSVYQTTGALAV